jgi:hypothetical protein
MPKKVVGSGLHEPIGATAVPSGRLRELPYANEIYPHTLPHILIKAIQRHRWPIRRHLGIEEYVDHL